MVDNENNVDSGQEAHASAPYEDPAKPEADHPQAGIAPEGWSAPQSDIATHGAAMGCLTVKRGGAETDLKFSFQAPAIIGRFDPTVGPIDVDLASLPEGSYVSRKHAKITCDAGSWKITDLGSSNGTFVLRDQFDRVDEADLSDGMEIALGNARFVFHINDVLCTDVAAASVSEPVAEPTEADPQS